MPAKQCQPAAVKDYKAQATRNPETETKHIFTGKQRCVLST